LLPNAFSPNEDSVNDSFKPLNNNLSDMELTVYNRWGQQVFASSNPDTGWDGTYKSVEQELGVYLYYIEYSFEGDTQVLTQKGNVTLIR